jgi:DNA-binding MarR family transcriptional regulator
MNKKYIVRLIDDERQRLLQLTATGKAAADKIKHANILLQADANGPNWADDKMAQAFHCHCKTVRNIRQRFVEQGLDAALARKPQTTLSRQRILDGNQEAHLIALHCSPPPKGRGKWPLRLLADKLIELEIVECISDETVRQTLKKTFSPPPYKSAG